MKKVPLQNIKRETLKINGENAEIPNSKVTIVKCLHELQLYTHEYVRVREILRKLAFLATFPFFRNPPPTIRDPEKKPKKIMHPFSRLAFMNMKKKGFSVRQQKKFN